MCVLEGGYNLDSTATAGWAVIQTLLDPNSVLTDEELNKLKQNCKPNEVCIETISSLNDILVEVWPVITKNEYM